MSVQSCVRQSILTLLAICFLAVGCGRSAFDARNDMSAALEAGRSRSPSMDQAMLGMHEPAADTADEGTGPGAGGDKYDRIVENDFLRVTNHPLSTFSVDVDTASYAKVRQYLFEHSQLPRPHAVRIEELVNYFDYDYTPPAEDESEPFATHVAVTQCPWNAEHRLVRIALKGRMIEHEQRPQSNLVFLIDVSGSMSSPNRLPLLKRALGLLLDQLNDNDRIAIVVYAGAAGMVLDSTPASERQAIMGAMNRLQAGGSTNGGRGLSLAYQLARDHFIEGGTNRILLCTDGDFNVGATGTDQMLDLVEKESKQGTELTVLGFGMGNFNDAMLEQISGRGNGNYAFIDTINEARKVLVDQLSGTLVTIAKDVKLQIEFNPAEVAAYRLIGYENRLLENQDFNDDKKDAGEIGAGHAVTALYEIIPSDVSTVADLPVVDELRYQENPVPASAASSGELLTLKLRYKLPGQDESQLLAITVSDGGGKFREADSDFQFASAVAGFGMLLRKSQYSGDWNYDTVHEIAASATGKDPHGLRNEFLELVRSAQVFDNRDR
jgi:Ca-activated chloride channel family protein